MSILLWILKIHLITVYFFIKIFHVQKKQVCFLSRQSNELSLNYKMIMQELDKENIKYKYILKKVNNSVNETLRTQGNYSNFNNFLVSIFKNLKSVISYYFSLYAQMRLIASSKVVVIDGYNLPVCLLKHKKGTTVIQIWHALGAVKKFGYQVLGKKDGVSPKVAKILNMHYNYDYVISCTKEMNKVLAEAFSISEDKILNIGTPTIDYLQEKNNDKVKEIYNEYPNLKSKKNVVYVPTFRVSKINGLDELIKSFDFKKYNLVVKLHPKDTNKINDRRVVNGKNFNTNDLIKIADFVITDYSSLMIDTLVANKKLLLYVYDYNTYTKNNGLNINLLKEYPNITKVNAKEINKILKKDQYDLKEYQKFYNKYNPNLKSCTKKIVELIQINI